MNPTLAQLETGKAHIEALRHEAWLARATATAHLSWRQRVARGLKRLAAQLEPEPQASHA